MSPAVALLIALGGLVFYLQSWFKHGDQYEIGTIANPPSLLRHVARSGDGPLQFPSLAIEIWAGILSPLSLAAILSGMRDTFVQAMVVWLVLGFLTVGCIDISFVILNRLRSRD